MKLSIILIIIAFSIAKSYDTRDMFHDLKNNKVVKFREGYDNGFTIRASENAGQQLGVPTPTDPTPFPPTHPTGQILQQVGTLMSFGHDKNPNPHAGWGATATYNAVMAQQSGSPGCGTLGGLGASGEDGEWDCGNRILFLNPDYLPCSMIPPNSDPTNFYYPNNINCPISIVPDSTATRLLRYRDFVLATVTWSAPFTSFNPGLNITASVDATVLGATGALLPYKNHLCMNYTYPPQYPYVDWSLWVC